MRKRITDEHRKRISEGMRRSHQRRKQERLKKQRHIDNRSDDVPDYQMAREKLNQRPKRLMCVHEDYLEAMENFHRWCESRNLNFRTEVALMLNARMQQ